MYFLMAERKITSFVPTSQFLLENPQKKHRKHFISFFAFGFFYGDRHLNAKCGGHKSVI